MSHSCILGYANHVWEPIIEAFQQWSSAHMEDKAPVCAPRARVERCIICGVVRTVPENEVWVEC